MHLSEVNSQAQSVPLLPGQVYRTANRPCDDPRANFQRMRSPLWRECERRQALELAQQNPKLVQPTKQV